MIFENKNSAPEHSGGDFYVQLSNQREDYLWSTEYMCLMSSSTLLE